MERHRERSGVFFFFFFCETIMGRPIKAANGAGVKEQIGRRKCQMESLDISKDCGKWMK
jgi:hypothetical protein